MCLVPFWRTRGRAKSAGRQAVANVVEEGGGGGGPGRVEQSLFPAGHKPQKFKLGDVLRWTDDFSAHRLLGIGGLGAVYKACLPDGVRVAVKREKPQSPRNSAQFMAEVELLSNVHHQNLVKLLGYCNEAGERILVHEYMAKGTLRHNLSRKREPPLDWLQRLNIAIGAAGGITYLHAHVHPPIIHHDIKSSNILLNENLVAKVADFALCTSATVGAEATEASVWGTPGYMDPHANGEVSEKLDVYSFGVVLLEIVTAKSPTWRGKHIITEMKRYRDEGRTMALVDPRLRGRYEPQAMEEYVELALRCTDGSGTRPAMIKVWSTLEKIRNSVLKHGSMDDTTSGSHCSPSFAMDTGGPPHEVSLQASPQWMAWASQATSTNRTLLPARRLSATDFSCTQEQGSSQSTSPCMPGGGYSVRPTECGASANGSRESLHMNASAEADGYGGCAVLQTRIAEAGEDLEDTRYDEHELSITVIEMLTEVVAR
ncbi:hypothetical protein CBR_g41500 [Chara braunii]|uniref:Protein kinase domain-containing protein n=1 Tax=Chara braunii TaxID=69332 RepID=A0A388LVZ9_CHABU|nr:hypothetical protein CBR_g41500 [Chara braunii]|eukprot:GBG86507.1 hypothetical protein CBR_g41500 [Chara braunii]